MMRKWLHKHLPETMSFVTAVLACAAFLVLFGRNIVFTALVIAYAAAIISAIFYYRAERADMWLDLAVKDLVYSMFLLFWFLWLWFSDIGGVPNIWVFILPLLLAALTLVATLPVHIIYRCLYKKKLRQNPDQGSNQP